MSATKTEKYVRKAFTVEALEYDGTGPSAVALALWMRAHHGTVFAADELLWRHDMGTYYHPEHGFIYLPGATRNPNGRVGGPGPTELVIKTGPSAFTLVFPGDYVIRGRSGFYPLSAESFHRGHRQRTLPGNVHIP